jgi:hypothetical protein
MAKRGRPSKFTPELGLEICEAISTGTMGLHRLCTKNKHWPVVTQIYRWLLDLKDKEKDDFRHQYAIARKMQAELYAEKLLEVIEPKKSDGKGFGVGGQHIARARLQADTLKWITSKMLPKVYGDKLDITSDGEKIEPVQIVMPSNIREEKK